MEYVTVVLQQAKNFICLNPKPRHFNHVLFTVLFQILTHTKPSASLAPPQPPAPPTHLPASHLAVPPISYHLQGSMPLGGCGSTPSTPTGGLPGTLSQASAGPPSAGIFASSSGTDLGSTSSEGRGDSDKVKVFGVRH